MGQAHYHAPLSLLCYSGTTACIPGSTRQLQTCMGSFPDLECLCCSGTKRAWKLLRCFISNPLWQQIGSPICASKVQAPTLEVVEYKSIVVKVLVFSQKVGRLNEKGATSNCQVVEADVPKQANSQMLRTRNVTITGFAVLEFI